MIKIVHTNSENPDFRLLTSLLDEDLSSINGPAQKYYDNFNVIESLNTVVLAYIDKTPVGCGCFKHYNDNSAEIKRMFVHPEFRGKGISKLILNELEAWMIKFGLKSAILETGINQTEAISLYKKSGYKKIENFGQYEGLELSVCFQKYL